MLYLPLENVEMAEPKEARDAKVADDLRGAAKAIAGVIVSVFDGVDHVRDRLIELHRDVVARHEEFTPDHLAQLRPEILAELERRPLLDGLGVLSAPDLFAERIRCIEWWRHDADAIVPIWLNFDPTSVDIYDYLQMEWFLRAQRDNARTVSGPYLDYTGADHYVVTMMTPANDDGFLGVVGADVRMSLFEAEILPILYELDRDVVLVNAERRVVSASSQHWTVGSRLASMPSVSGDFVAVAEVGSDSEWVLAALGAQ